MPCWVPMPWARPRSLLRRFVRFNRTSSSQQPNGSTVKVQRQTEAGYDDVECPLPAVVTVTAGVVEPRYPSFKGIMAARSKPIDVLTLADLGLAPADVGAAGARQE